MEKLIFFGLAIPILGFVFYLGGTAIMKGFKAKVDNRPVKPEEKEEYGGDPEVRHRRTRRHTRGGTGVARGRAGAPGHRGAHHHPHPRPQPARAGPAAHLRPGGGGPEPGDHRAQRRHHRSCILAGENS